MSDMNMPEKKKELGLQRLNYLKQPWEYYEAIVGVCFLKRKV